MICSVCFCQCKVHMLVVARMMNPKAQTHWPSLQASPGALHLADVCVCVCVQGTAVLQRFKGRSVGDMDELQLWPRGLWELWLEQRGRRRRRRLREEGREMSRREEIQVREGVRGGGLGFICKMIWPNEAEKKKEEKQRDRKTIQEPVDKRGDRRETSLCAHVVRSN